MEVSVLAALLGGALSLLSPCGALLLPGFLASTVTRRGALAVHGLVFYLGLVVTLVPLGLGIGALGALLTTYRGMLIGATSVLLIVLGVLHLLGIGFDPARVLPGADALRRRSAHGSGLPRTFLLGAAGGVAGFCAGPILGAVLTLAFGHGSTLMAGLLLAVYGAGMVLPLVVLATVWDALSPRATAVLRGREIAVAGRRLHTTNLVTGMLIIVLGVLFWVTNGLVTLPSLLPTETLARWQNRAAELDGVGLQITVIVVLGLLALVLWWMSTRRSRRRAVRPHDSTGQSNAPGRHESAG